MSDGRPVEIYATFLKLTGRIEMVGPDRLTDTVNRVGDLLQLQSARAEPLSPNSPVLSSDDGATTVFKSAVTLICPTEDGVEGNTAMWREKVKQQVTINTAAYSLVGDVHLELRHSFRDHIERFQGDFIPITTVSAVWLGAIGAQTQALQRPFALLNPATILSFSLR